MSAPSTADIAVRLLETTAKSMKQPRLMLAGLLAVSLLAGLSSLWGDDAVQQTEQARPAPQAICLEQPEHWSALPQFVEGNELICSRYLRFETPDGRTIHARMFLIEFHARNLTFDENLPVEDIVKRQAIPSRMACIGHEITVDEGYAPDFDVPVNFVKPHGPCAYMVDLGAVPCFIRTTPKKVE